MAAGPWQRRAPSPWPWPAARAHTPPRRRALSARRGSHGIIAVKCHHASGGSRGRQRPAPCSGCNGDWCDGEHAAWREAHQEERGARAERLRRAAEGAGQKVVLDLEFADLMRPNEIHSLTQQVKIALPLLEYSELKRSYCCVVGTWPVGTVVSQY